VMLRSARTNDVIIMGSGLAGLVCALELAPRPVTLITKTPQLDGGSSILAKGGIAAAIGLGDTPGHHAHDTLSAGAGLSDPGAALQRTESRGAHYRDDYPKPAAKWQRHQSLTLDQLNAA